MLRINPDRNTSKNLRWIELNDFPTHYSRVGSSTPAKQPIVDTLKILTTSIINALRLIGVNIVTVDNPDYGYVLLGYDENFGIVIKDYEGYLTPVKLQ